MARPVFIVEADLTKEETLYYLPLGAKSKDHGERIKLCMRLRITHDNSRHEVLTINRITFSFPGSSLGVEEMDMVPERNMDPEDGVLRRGNTANWFNGSWRDANEDWHFNQVYLDAPAPQRVQVNIYCKETDGPFSQSFDLASRTGTPLLLPFKVEDSADDEYIVTSAVHNFNGPPDGTQIFGHDISIQARSGGEWRRTFVSNPSKNEDARIFGRPIRAQAHGVVHDVTTGFWDNEYGGGNRTDEHYGANRVIVIYDDLMVIYSHLKADSIVVQPGDFVWPGRKLGEGGNSGNTKGSPHLHMECRLHPSGRLCGMTFKNSWMLARDLVPADNGPGRRVRLDKRGICKEKAALRPFATQVRPPKLARPDVEMDEIVAEVFGGVSKGGDGFVIVNGKLTRVPPRGIRADLLNAIAELDAIDEIGARAGRARTADVAKKIAAAAEGLKG